MRTRTAAVLFVATALGLMARPAAAAAGPLTATGTVTGVLKAGQALQVHLVVKHTGGWQKIEDVEVALLLRGVPLETVVVDPTHVSVVIEGKAGPAALGETQQLVGSFLSLNAGTVGLSAKGDQLSLTLPMQVRGTPPGGARLTYQAKGFDLTSTTVRNLTPPAESGGGFSWGTLAVAAAAALFAGSFLGGTFASRRRPPIRPSVYATVQRRLEEERSKR
ncbi:MAG TPA: hypothetical protein VKA30_12085 [Actinomycetota bacterium]|nr:hypothetical protein [Actinomycetota bacterium]